MGLWVQQYTRATVSGRERERMLKRPSREGPALQVGEDHSLKFFNNVAIQLHAHEAGLARSRDAISLSWADPNITVVTFVVGEDGRIDIEPPKEVQRNREYDLYRDRAIGLMRDSLDPDGFMNMIAEQQQLMTIRFMPSLVYVVTVNDERPLLNYFLSR